MLKCTFKEIIGNNQKQRFCKLAENVNGGLSLTFHFIILSLVSRSVPWGLFLDNIHNSFSEHVYCV